MPIQLKEFDLKEKVMISNDNLKKCISGIADIFDKELFDKTNEELEEYWFFKWDNSRSIYWNIYQFHDLLKLYSNFCRRWEEHHNGSCCVVEKVRDKYIMPKIKIFYNELKHKMGTG